MRWPAWIRSTRQNHAVEHATVHLLTARHPGVRLIGRSDWRGFWLYGEIDSGNVSWAVHEALGRLAARQSDLAIHPRCGTNLAAGGLLVLGAAYAAFAVPGRSRLQRLLIALGGVVAALFGSQSLGRFAQERVTTNADVRGVHVREIRCERRGQLLVHRVLLGQRASSLPF